MKILDFIGQTLRGKSIYRVLFNQLVEKHSSDLKGRVLDVAGGSNPSYRSYLPRTIELVSGDVSGQAEARLDFDQPFPFADREFNEAFLFNAIYICSNPSVTLREIHRVVRAGGRLLVASPYLVEEIPEPHDYQRLTREGLTRLVTDAGFSVELIEPFGNRFSSAAYLLHPVWLISPLRLVVNPLAIFLDFLLAKITRTSNRAPLGYFVVCKKR